MSDELTYWQAEAYHWRAEAQRLRNVLGEIDRATTARHATPIPPEPPVQAEATTDRGRFTNTGGGWHCLDPDCRNCPCQWDEVCAYGQETAIAVELPAANT